MEIKQLLLYLILLLFTACGLNHPRAEPFFKEPAYEAYESEDYVLALDLTTKLRMASTPNSNYYFWANYYEGRILSQQGCYVESIPRYEALTQISNFKKKLHKTGLYSDQFWEARQEVALMLANSFLEIGHYEKALENIRLAEEVYTYFGCGLGALEKHEKRNDLKLQVYLGKEDLDEVLQLLNRSLFEYPGEASELDQVISMIKERYSKTEIRQALDVLLEKTKAYPIEDVYENGYYFSTVLFNREIQLMDSYAYWDHIEYTGEIITNEDLYKIAEGISLNLRTCIKESAFFQQLAQY